MLHVHNNRHTHRYSNKSLQVVYALELACEDQPELSDVYLDMHLKLHKEHVRTRYGGSSEAYHKADPERYRDFVHLAEAADEDMDGNLIHSRKKHLKGAGEHETCFRRQLIVNPRLRQQRKRS